MSRAVNEIADDLGTGPEIEARVIAEVKGLFADRRADDAVPPVPYPAMILPPLTKPRGAFKTYELHQKCVSDAVKVDTDG